MTVNQFISAGAMMCAILGTCASLAAQATIAYGRTVTVRSSSTTGTGHGKFGIIQRYDINNNQPSLFGVIHNTANARCANISPDGNRVAFLRNDNKICIRNMDGTGSEQVLGSILDASSGWIDWPMSDWIYISPNFGRNGLKRINTTTGVVQDLGDLQVTQTWTLSVSANGTRACISANHNGWTSYIVEIGAAGVSSVRHVGACGGSISPDGSLFTLNNGDHANCEVKRFSDRVSHKTWSTARCPSAGGNWNRHRWSSSSNDWVTFTQGTPYQMESYHNQVLYYVPDAGQTRIQVTSNGNGVYNEGDDFWIQQQNAPALRLTPSSLSFSYSAGASLPVSQNVSVTNAGTGTLPAINVVSSVAWLTVQKQGSGNSYTLTNSVNPASLAGGVHTATVTVSGSGIASAAYTVQLTIVVPPVLTSIRVANAYVVPGGTVQCVATGYNQYDQPMSPQPSFAWSVTSGGGSVSASGVYSAPSMQGSATVRAASGAVSGTGTVTIAQAPPVHLKVDCGQSPATGWVSDAAYLVEGNDWVASFSFGSTVNLTGVVNPAPAVVYQTSPLSQNRNVYAFSALPVGTYRVRFHFMLGSEHTGLFKMDYTIQGVKVLDDFDVKTDAGGYDKGVVKEFTAQVTDASGLRIVGQNDGGTSVFVGGIEVIGGATTKPAITILEPTGGGRYAVGDTLPVRWTCDTTRVTGVLVELSLDGGESWTIISGTSSIGARTAGTDEGVFRWKISALLGSQSVISQACVVKVTDYMERSLLDESDGLFAIAQSSQITGSQPVLRGHSVPGSESRVRYYDISGRRVSLSATVAGGVRISVVDEAAQRCGGGARVQLR